MDFINNPGIVLSTTTLDGDTSNIVTLSVPNEASYEFEAKFNGGEPQRFNFSTTRTPNIAYVSCCGYKSRIVNDNIDNDSETLKKLSEEDYNVMIHMGDQIYGDSIKNTINSKNESIDFFEKKYREMYREVFGSIAMQNILRKGSHIMVCDDHDFFDGVDSTHNTDPCCIAAKNMYMEYQEKLWSDTIDTCKVLEYENNNIIIPNIKYNAIFFYNTDTPFISDVLQTRVINAIKRDKKNVLVTSLPILANNKFGSWLKSKLASTEKDDSTHPHKYDNTIDFLDRIRNTNNLVTFVSGDLHLSSRSYIYYKKVLTGEQLVSSGLTKVTTVNINSSYFYFLIMDKFNFGSYKLGNYKSCFSQRSYDTNYTIIFANKYPIRQIKQYRGNNFQVKNLYNNHFHKLNLLTTIIIVGIIRRNKIKRLIFGN